MLVSVEFAQEPQTADTIAAAGTLLWRHFSDDGQSSIVDAALRNIRFN